MKLFRRTPKPAPKPVDPAKVAAGLRAYADDLDAGITFALDGLTSRGEMPFHEGEWAAYPTSVVRLACREHYGRTGECTVPDADLDRLCDAIEARTAMERLRTALEEAGVVTDPAALTDDQIAHLTGLAYRANAALKTARVPH